MRILALVGLAVAATWHHSAAPACSARELRPVGGMLQGATGSMLGFVRFRNVSSTACRAGGRPALRIFDLNGRRLPTRERSLSARQVGLTEVRTVAPGTRVALYLFWSEWCGRWPGTQERRLILHATLTTGGRLTARFRSGRPRCDVRTGSTLAVTPFGIER